VINEGEGLDDGDNLMCIIRLVEFKKSLISMQVLYIYYDEFQVFFFEVSFFHEIVQLDNNKK
jgi:hypothetical protein